MVCLCMGPLLRGQDHRLPPGPRGVLGGMRCAAWPLWRLEVVLQRRLLSPSIAQTNRGATWLLPDRLAGVANPTARQVLWEAYGEQSTRWFYDLMPLICKNPKRQAESLRCGWAGLDAPLGFQGAPL